MVSFDLDLSKYDLGWSDEVEYAVTPEKGINPGVVEQISWWKGEPRWMTQFRQRAYKLFERKPMAEWFAVNMPDIDFQDMLARIAPGLPLAAFAVGVTGGDRLADFAVPLTDAAAAVLAIAEVRHIELRQGDADEVVPLTADHLAVRDVFSQVVSYLPANDLFEPRRVAVDFHDHIAWQVRNLPYFFFTSPRAKMLATKFSTSVALLSL